MKTEFSTRLLNWYAVHQRSLPWRDTTDPYAIWVAEIMLQQTRVDTVLPYYFRWMERFPTVASLAAATQQQVLQTWEGLGYYSRARNIHKTAQILVEKYHGQIPSDRKTLDTLPGIGKAGSADILSIAFGQDFASVDGNIRRVIARLFNIDTELGSLSFEAAVQAKVDEHLPPGQAGDYNQAWMDLGATICTSDQPLCEQCPFTDLCQAKQLQLQHKLPVRKVKLPVPVYTVAAGIIRRGYNPGKQVLISRRPADGLLGGMWEFPGGKIADGETLPECLVRELNEELGITVQVGEQQGIYRHAYTHFKVILHAFFCQIQTGDPKPIQSSELAWVDLSDLVHYPMGKIDRMISEKLLPSTSNNHPD